MSYLDRVSYVFSVLLGILTGWIAVAFLIDWVAQTLPVISLAIGLIMFVLLWRYLK